MKYLITALIPLFLVSCISSQKDFSQDNHLKSETRVLRDGDVAITKTYRDDNLIMIEMIQKSNRSHTRSLFLNNDAVYSESDKDGDGFFESIMIHGKKFSDFEMSIRLKDGSIRPVPTERYKEIQLKANEASTKLRDALKESVFSENEKLEKEGKVIDGWLKEQIEELKDK